MSALLVSYAMQWLQLLSRWLHVVAGIAWIGASFYFIWLDHALQAPEPGSASAREGVAGELWAVHGGGFYHPQKYLVAPARLPVRLHWFKWEAYATWLSGFALLVLAYYCNASAMMIDKSVADLTGAQSVAVGVAALVLGWIAYDLLCRSPWRQRTLLSAITLFVVVVAVHYLLTRLLSGRAAMLHVGAMLGTIMAGNVLVVIIPCQRRLVAAMRQHRTPDPEDGKRAKQRSVHNNYITLPVLFIMISNHYAMLYRHTYSWLILAAIMAAGVLIRHYFNQRHSGYGGIAYPATGVLLLLGVALAMAPMPAPSPATVAAGPPPEHAFARVRRIVVRRCASCHAAHPTQAGFATAPGGILLDSPAQIRRHAEPIYRHAVRDQDMPLGNLTGMTRYERAFIGAWYEAGAP